MAYATPTTKAEMYEILNEIYIDYRIRKEPFEALELENIVLDKLTFSPKSYDTKKTEAQVYVQPWYDDTYESMQKEISRNKYGLIKQKESVLENKNIQVAQVKLHYKDLQTELEEKALHYGYNSSELLINEINELKSQLAKELERIEEEYTDKINKIDEEISEITVQESQLNARLTNLFNHRVSARMLEIQEAEKQLEMSIIKYNNDIEEKMQKSRNSNLNANANLRIKHIEIQAKGYTKEELIQRGYYTQMLDCVSAFYSSDYFETPYLAYIDLLDEVQLIVYLDEFYSDLLELFRVRGAQ